jgi:hypothetical protein
VGAALLSEAEPVAEQAPSQSVDAALLAAAAGAEFPDPAYEVEAAAIAAEGDADFEPEPVAAAESSIPSRDTLPMPAAESGAIRVQTVLIPGEGEPAALQTFTPPPQTKEPVVESAPVQVASLPAVEVVTTPESVGDIPAAAASEGSADPSAWPEHAVDCPRDWLGDEEGSAAGGPGCPAITTLIEEASPAEELDRIVSERAEQVAALMPRLPRARPEPPPQPIRRQARSTPRASPNLSWPDEPPPNCGSKHAYWRFVDEARTQKEWYCK